MLPFQIVDSHLHFWDPENLSYPWLAQFPTLNERRDPGFLDRARGEVMIEKLVLVEADVAPAHRSDEVRWLSSLAESDSRIGAIVANAPIDEGEKVRPYLEELKQQPLVKGVRRLMQDEPIAALESPSWVEGLKLLPEYDLSFDLCLRHHQLPAILPMVRSCPEVSFVVDHCAKPDIKGRVLDPWREHIKELSQLDNVSMKISGLVTEADHEKWKAFKLKPYIDHVLECFGFERVMFGSDWPVMSLAADYSPWIEAVLFAVEGCRESQMMALFRNNAKAFYKLDI